MDNTSSASYRDIDLKKVLADMARAIVDDPDSVSVTEEENESGTVLTLKVAEADMGMIIGKHGKIARATHRRKSSGKSSRQKGYGRNQIRIC